MEYVDVDELDRRVRQPGQGLPDRVARLERIVRLQRWAMTVVVATQLTQAFWAGLALVTR